MATSITAPGPDIVAPVVSGALPTGTLPAGTTSATLQVTTNESATCRYATTPGTAYGQMATTFATTGGTAHSQAITGLANGQSYTFYVRCQDTAGNATTSDTVASFAVAAPGGSGNQFSMQFFGNGTGQIDRVEIPLTPNRTIDVGGDFTLEWWMRATPGNTSGTCVAGSSWVNGNILIDRDVFGPGDFGDFGVSLFAADGRIAFGVSADTNATTLCSTVGVERRDLAPHRRHPQRERQEPWRSTSTASRAAPPPDRPVTSATATVARRAPTTIPSWCSEPKSTTPVRSTPATAA